MKTIKKLASLLLALVMVFTMSVTASAATVTVNQGEDGLLTSHTFTAYQIFKGDEHEGVLSNIVWGDNVEGEAFLEGLQTNSQFNKTTGEEESAVTENIFKNCQTAADVAEVLTANQAYADAFAKFALDHIIGDGTALTDSATLDDGYYLIVDTTEGNTGDVVYNAALLQVVGNITIQVKTDKPTVEKKVKEDDKYKEDGGYGTGYNDVADYDMNEKVSFHLIGTVPDMTYYDTYKYIFHDTMSEGLTAPEEESIKVYVSDDKKVDDADTDVTEKFTIKIDKNLDGTTSITVSCDDIKEFAKKGQYIIVEYEATLNEDAVVGLDGNPNEVTLEYSNQPDHSGAGDTDNTGETPKDVVIVFTYELDVTKVDGKDTEKKLQDAQFVLLNADKTKVAIVDSDKKVQEWVDVPADGKTWPAGSILTSDADGGFSVIGLDDGTYYLREIKAPAGYNLLASDVKLVIKATTTNGQEWTSQQAKDALTALTIKVNDGSETEGNVADGTVSMQVENNEGSKLPETGGIGTTIFYTVGAILVIGAVVLLVTKRRMGNVE